LEEPFRRPIERDCQRLVTRYAVRRAGVGPETEEETRIDLQSDGVQMIRPRWRVQGVSLH